ncbi:type III secretion system effector inositol phosphate phosphatase [Chromobacterium sinusclupearum]|uniref:Type III secretion system effector inositol phosphate phosphatase n=1 Tax=Chromobacterium sinusclupearum TaxID=2077146 RepID=A0A2K4MU67_9NEIS|nr:type III secretion system effector inositol phosphate phosphatase [Chromobacterium sinusclupearum]POB00635.1 type III secretion system effector inositol phosphate phosphatase [Chromobacterium sinusclupearum]
MSLLGVIGFARQLFRLHGDSAHPVGAGRLGASIIATRQADIPLRISRLEGEEMALLSQLQQPASPSTRSVHALFILQQNRIEAAAQALRSLGEDPTELRQLAQQLEASRFKQDRPATREELKRAKRLQQDLLALISSRLVRAGMLAKDAQREAKIAYREASQQVLNARPWNTVSTHFDYRGQRYDCTMVPAAQMKLGDTDIFPIPYRGQGVCCESTRETAHAANLWTSEIKAQSGETLFKGVRHAILSPYALEKGSIARREGAQNRACEVVAAALFARPELLDNALTGEVVPLQLVSTSLVTGGFWNEKDMLDDQVAAWNALSSERPLELTLMDATGQPRTVRILLEVAAFNFGVNELALKFQLGHAQADAYNAAALQQLLGTDLRVEAEPQGWVGAYLAREPKPDNANRVWWLSRQLKAIWAAKAHRHDGGEPYKAAQRAALLAYEIGAVPCWNCKSGKDRTGMLDAELKREAVALHQGGGLAAPGARLESDEQQLLQQILLYGGNGEVQAYNTGASGNKVMKELPALNLSYQARVGNREVWDQAQGLSGLVKS